MAEVLGGDPEEDREEAATMNVVWSPRAISHLTAMREYIEKDSDGNAAQVAARILDAIGIFQTQPQMGRPGRFVGTRELVVSGTPYVIPYRVRRERLELLAVFDGRRQWPQRP
jgi:toxin ParE1/3/4